MQRDEPTEVAGSQFITDGDISLHDALCLSLATAFRNRGAAAGLSARILSRGIQLLVIAAVFEIRRRSVRLAGEIVTNELGELARSQDANV
jgi:hypothetical protein